jgi:hypothetical protein
MALLVGYGAGICFAVQVIRLLTRGPAAGPSASQHHYEY